MAEGRTQGASRGEPAAASCWPFGDLRPLSYSMLMADPPWSFQLYSEKGEAKSAQAKYECMSLDEIAALPVDHLTAADAILFI